MALAPRSRAAASKASAAIEATFARYQGVCFSECSLRLRLRGARSLAPHAMADAETPGKINLPGLEKFFTDLGVDIYSDVLVLVIAFHSA